MKKLILAAAVVAAPTQAFAAENTNGLDAFVSAAVGYQDSGVSGDVPATDSGDDVSFELRGSVAVPLGSAIGVQADVGYARDPLNFPGAPFDISLKSTTVAAHVFYRNSDQFLLGVIGQTNFNTLAAQEFNLDTKQYFIGGEGQVYLNNVTLGAQVAYRKDSLSLGQDLSMDGIVATAEAKYFINSNWSLGLKGEYSRIVLDGEDVNVKQWRLGLGTERRLSSVPVSLFANLNYGEGKANVFEDVKLHDTRFMVGIKINFGSGTLLERNRSGASLDPFKVESPLVLLGA